MDKKKVLIITYYWPPSGGGGVQRWVKFVKYLNDFGWEPIVYAPENPNYPIIDKSLSADIPNDIKIIKQKIWEPYEAYNKIAGSKKDSKIHAGLISEKNEKKSLKKEALLWVRGNLFIPDARKFWIKPSYKFLKKYITKNNIEHIITTGPPHSMHVIGLKLKKKLKVKWVADFRDPWLYMDNNINDLKYTKRTFNKHLSLETQTLKLADEVITVTKKIALDYEKQANKKIHVITNGFDESDFTSSTHNYENFIIGHYGTLGKYRNPNNLWKILGEKIKTDSLFNEKLKIELIGPVDGSVLNDISKNKLENHLTKIDYLSHKKVTKKMMEASILLLLLDKNFSMEGRMTGKIFEYLAAKRPIIGLGSTKSDPVKVLNETKSGIMIEYDNRKKIEEQISKSFELFKNKKLDLADDSYKIYSRKELTKQLAKILDTLV